MVRALARLAQKEVELNQARAKLLAREQELRYQQGAGRLAPERTPPEPGPGDVDRSARPPYAEDWCLEPEVGSRPAPSPPRQPGADSSAASQGAPSEPSRRAEQRTAPPEDSAAGALPSRHAAARAAEGRASDLLRHQPHAEKAARGGKGSDPSDPPAGEVKYTRQAGVSALLAPSSAGATAPSVHADSLIEATVSAAKEASRLKARDRAAEYVAKAKSDHEHMQAAGKVAEREYGGRAADAFQGVGGWANDNRHSAPKPSKPAPSPPPAPCASVPRGDYGAREYFQAHSGFGVRSDQMRRKP